MMHGAQCSTLMFATRSLALVMFDTPTIEHGCMFGIPHVKKTVQEKMC